MGSDEQIGAGGLTLEQRATNYETLLHIARVRDLLGEFIVGLLHRAREHDQSKLASPEVEAFTEYGPLLGGLTYGSVMYETYRQRMAEALAHHYAHNRHHPEHHEDGVDGMNLLDLFEMFADWKASSERHKDGDILKSIEHNAIRFNLSPQLVRILVNTGMEMGWVKSGPAPSGTEEHA